MLADFAIGMPFGAVSGRMISPTRGDEVSSVVPAWSPPGLCGRLVRSERDVT